MKTTAPNPILAPSTFQRGLTTRPDGDFWQSDVLFDERFARNRCEISAGVVNLTDTDYQLDPVTNHGTLPRKMTAVLRCKFTF